MVFKKPSEQTVDNIARICHEANRAYCMMLGDFTQAEWDDAHEWQRESARAGVLFAFENPKASPGAQHMAWVAHKVKDGWTYGVKDAEAKTHPSLLPFAQLPESEQRKDVLFTSIVRCFFPK